MRVLVFNCGSSSLKFELIELDAGAGRRLKTIGRGTFEGIGGLGRRVLIDSNGTRSEHAESPHDHAAAALEAIDWLESITSGQPLRADAVAHRIVHGGPDLAAPAIATASVLDAIEAASVFAPLHNPVSLGTLRAVSGRLPHLPCVIVADTFFHQTIPDYAREYAIPRALAARHRIRRYGFHGIAHAWMVERYAELEGKNAGVNLITLQLGAGCSVAAIRNGQSIDTSMGLTPLEGLMMATRSGDLDPAIVSFLSTHENLAASKVEEILNHNSGLLGVSGISGDLRAVEAAAKAGNRDAVLAIEMFCYRIRKYLGAYRAALGSVDAIVFGGGIGEHAADVRAKICEPLKTIGLELDPALNVQADGRERRISADRSPIKIMVIPVDEEQYIAKAAARLVTATHRAGASGAP
ncbi:MAG: acetate/propionate family kinase [Candidatus Binataceae bacterium]|nr:acetate/propionate family kinase [Candidatus Binataceae bacterium]